MSEIEGSILDDFLKNPGTVPPTFQDMLVGSVKSSVLKLDFYKPPRLLRNSDILNSME